MREADGLNRSRLPFVSMVMISRILVALVVAAAFLVVSAGSAAGACLCQCLRFTPQQHMDRADAVFTATARKVRVVGQKAVATLRVDHVYKGQVNVLVEVSTRAEGPACGYQFKEGARYLLFAGQEVSGLATSSCSGNAEIAAGDLPLRPSRENEDMGLTRELITTLGTPTPVRVAKPVFDAVAVVLKVRMTLLQVQLDHQ